MQNNANFKLVLVWNIIWERQFLWNCNIVKLRFMRGFNIFGAIDMKLFLNSCFFSTNFSYKLD